jgi:uncharacterized membrane protein YhaH (DUF805 family)
MEKQAERVGLVGAIKNFFRCYATFSGKSSRSEYWFLWIAGILLQLMLVVLVGVAAVSGVDLEDREGWFFLIGNSLIYITLFALVVPSLAIMSRRLRDGGISPYFLFFVFLPILGWLALFVMMMFPSKEPSSP